MRGRLAFPRHMLVFGPTHKDRDPQAHAGARVNARGPGSSPCNSPVAAMAWASCGALNLRSTALQLRSTQSPNLAMPRCTCCSAIIAKFRRLLPLPCLGCFGVWRASILPGLSRTFCWVGEDHSAGVSPAPSPSMQACAPAEALKACHGACGIAHRRYTARFLIPEDIVCRRC